MYSTDSSGSRIHAKYPLTQVKKTQVMPEFDAFCPFLGVGNLFPHLSKALGTGVRVINTNKVGFLPSTPSPTMKTEMLKENLAKKHRKLQYLHASFWPAE